LILRDGISSSWCSKNGLYKIHVLKAKYFSKLFKFMEFTSAQDRVKTGLIRGAVQSRKSNVSILLMLKISWILKIQYTMYSIKSYAID
jgi:hypothetical protein